MADEPTVWKLDDLMQAAMAGAHDADTEEEFAEQTVQGVEVCARRIHQSDGHTLSFSASVNEENSLEQVFESLDELEQTVKKRARVWYCAFTDRDLREWNEMYQGLPIGSSTNRSVSTDETRSYTDDDSFDPYGVR